MSELSVVRRDEGACTVVEVSGDVEVISASVLRGWFAKLLHEGRSDVVLDMAKVTFIDSTGLGVLVGALRTLRSLGGDMRLASPPARVQRVFSITGVDQVLAVYDSVEDATAACGSLDEGPTAHSA